MIKKSAVVAGLLASGLVLSACGDDEEPEGDDTAAAEDGATDENAEDATDEETTEAAGGTDWGDCDPTANAAAMPDPEGTGEDETELTIGVMPGWDESYALGYLLDNVLEQQGYTVEFEELDADITYEGVANGDLDLMTDGWLPITHEDKLEEHGDSLENLGCWYDNAKLTIAVNEDAPIQSLDELAENADTFNNTLVGIDPGAGLTQITTEEVIPTYGLEDMDYPKPGGTAMLAELRAATDAGDNIVVTLWRPHWAYGAFPIRDLDDPENSLGGAEYIYSFGRIGFSEDYPNVAQLVQNVTMSDEELSDLERVMFSDEEFAGEDHVAAVEQWVSNNQEFVDNLKAGEL